MANVDHIAHKPKRPIHLEAAAIPLVGVSAWQALVENMRLSKDQKILIHGGAGGIGSIAIQLAKHIGALTVGYVEIILSLLEECCHSFDRILAYRYFRRYISVYNLNTINLIEYTH